MRRTFIILTLVSVCFFVVPAPETRAMEPVTIALLAPVALKVAQFLAPYIIKGLHALGLGLIDMGLDMLDFFRLPLGLFEISFGAPFDLFYDGLEDLGKGALAPCKMCLHALTLPIRPFRAIF